MEFERHERLHEQRREVVDERLVVRELVIHHVEERVHELVAKGRLQLRLERIGEQVDTKPVRYPDADDALAVTPPRARDDADVDRVAEELESRRDSGRHGVSAR